MQVKPIRLIRTKAARAEFSGLVRGLACLLLCMPVFAACGDEEQGGNDTPRPVHWQMVESVTYTPHRVLAGVLQPIDNADLSFEVRGKISTIPVEPGDMVEEGQILATLEKKTYALDLKRTEGQLQEAKARLSQAKNDYNRKAELYEVGAVSELEYEATKTQYESLQKQIETLTAQYSIALEKLEDTTLHAPYDGRISKRYLEPEQQTAPGNPVLRIQNQQGLEVSVSIPETFVQNITIGGTHSVRFPAYPDLNVSARLTELSSEANTAGSFPAILQLEQTPEVLKSGMTARVELALGSGLSDHKTGQDEAVFRIPLTALIAGDAENSFVFLYKEQNQSVHKTRVTVSEITRDMAYVSSGLAEGQKIITHGASFLQHGQRVKLIGTGTGWYQE